MKEIPDYRNEEPGFEERARDMVSKMTLEEKASQMLHCSPAIPRLGIKEYNWWNEALHGVARAGVATVFPQAIGLAATFDEELVYSIADIISTEGRARYHEFQRKGDRDIYKGLTFWSPNINIFRDPRWGRGQETYGEDPFLTGILGKAFIEGIQGGDGKYLKAAACAKHFAVHSGPEAERHEFDAQVTEKDLWETYLPAFRECVINAKVEAVMGAYNRTNGEPCCGSTMLLKKILREKWGFRGHVVSDCGAIKDFHENHKVTGTAPESVALAVNNGCDLNCGRTYANLLTAYKEGLVSEEKIDESVTRLMITRMKLGMFDSPKKVSFAGIPYEKNDCRQHHEAALDAAKKSIVLLKNENNLLPLDRNIKSVAVIGPNADSRKALEGNYNGTSSSFVTVLEGIKDSVSDKTRVYYAPGCHLYRDRVENLSQPSDRLAEAVAAAERSEAVILCLGLDAGIEGEEGDTSDDYLRENKRDLKLPGLQQQLLESIHNTGRPVILVLMSGSPLTVGWAAQNIPSILQAWYPGAQGGEALASIIFGEYSPSGRLPVTFYRTTEELPDFTDYSMENRTYRYMKNEALFPFGFGLSYTLFEYRDLTLSKKAVESGGCIEASVTVKNSGGYASGEAVQLYLKDAKASVRVPRWELKCIKKLYMKPGEQKRVVFQIVPEHMAVVDNEGRCILEPGRFIVYVGGIQPDEVSRKLTGSKVLKAEFNLEGTGRNYL